MSDRSTTDWLSEVLWPGGDGRIDPAPALGADPCVETGTGRLGTGWYATWDADGPRLLVPAGPPAARRAALHRVHDGHGAPERVRRAAAALAGALAPGRLLVPMAATGVPSPVLTAVTAALGVADARVALTLGPPRGNRKVVVQVLRADGAVAGYAKVAHDPTTRALVEVERAVLARLHGRAGRLLTPAPLGSVELPGRVAVLLGPLPSRWTGRRRTDTLTALAGDVHDAAGTAATRTLGTTPWAEATRAAVRGAEEATGAAVRGAEEATGAAVGDLLERWHDRPVRVGLAHGDLAPWNVLRGRTGIGLIDWEYALDGCPQGLDVLRGETQVALHLLHLAPDAALARSRRRADALTAADAAGGLGADELHLLHLADTVRRAADPSAGPADQDLGRLAAAALITARPTGRPARAGATW